MNTTNTMRNRISTLYDHVVYHADQLASGKPDHGRVFHTTALVSDCSTLEDLAAKAKTPWAEMMAKAANALTKQCAHLVVQS